MIYMQEPMKEGEDEEKNVQRGQIQPYLPYHLYMMIDNEKFTKFLHEKVLLLPILRSGPYPAHEG